MSLNPPGEPEDVAGYIRVMSAGPLSTLQDLGRTGYRRLGITRSGAADTRAFRLGNLLLRNQSNAAAIEITLGGFEAIFDFPAVFAITGAFMAPLVNGEPIPMWETLKAREGDRLSLPGLAALGAPLVGFRSYLSVSGGVAVPPILGSRATHVPSGLGGLNGRALQDGDSVPVGRSEQSIDAPLKVRGEMRPAYGREDIELRVTPGPQDDMFTEEAERAFLGAPFLVTDRTDRMGARLEGPEISAIDDRHGIVSDALVPGSIQVPPDKQPIVLLADCQTTGGYPKIGAVCGVDLPLLAQAAPGTRVRFRKVTMQEAQEEARAEARALSMDALAPTGRPFTRARYHVTFGGRAREVFVGDRGEGRRSTIIVDGASYDTEDGMTVS